MTQPIIFTLILLALVLPVLGAIVLRLLGPRLTLAQLYGGAALVFVVAVGSVLVLARGDIPSLQIGNLSILLPLTAPDDIALAPTTDSQSPPDVLPPPETLPATAVVLSATAQPTLAATTTLTSTTTPIATTAALAATTTLTATATTLPTIAATEQPATAQPATAIPATATPTPLPPTPVPPTAPPAPAAQRTYTVKPGDTLLSIARQFNTTVQAIIDANKLTPKQADALRVGQVLVIP